MRPGRAGHTHSEPACPSFIPCALISENLAPSALCFQTEDSSLSPGGYSLRAGPCFTPADVTHTEIAALRICFGYAIEIVFYAARRIFMLISFQLRASIRGPQR